MSAAEVLSLVSKISYAVAGISFALTVLLWFRFNIPYVIGDLSGRTARKSIERIREINEKSKGAGYGSSATNEKRGKLTSMMPEETNSTKEQSEFFRPETGLLNESIAEVSLESETVPLNDPDATETLEDTGSLETDSLERASTEKKELTTLKEIILVHTDEVIR